MHDLLKICGVGLAFLLLTACRERPVEPTCIDPSPTAQTIEILPLGDSRVEGARPSFESYRYALWKLLLAGEWAVDFIGNEIDLAEYPQVGTRCFDQNHQGEGGAYTTTILDMLTNETFSPLPEVVLLGIGGNDVLDEVRTVPEVVENLGLIIDELRSLNPAVIILLEQIAPARSDLMTEALKDLLDAYRGQIEDLVTDKNTLDAPIYLVDMGSDWSDTYMADAVHYNESGAQEVAQRYYDVLEANVLR